MRLLEERLRETQEGNEALMRRIREQRGEMEGLILGLEGLVADLEGGVEAMRWGGDGVDGLKAEIWEMESEIRFASSGGR